MHPPGADTVLVRYGDIGVKSPSVQRRMEGRLRQNLQAMLDDRGIDASVEGKRTRPLIHPEDPSEVGAATDAATDTFGVVSASPTAVVEPTMDAIRDALARTAREMYDAGSFAIDARRAGGPDAHPFTSQDLERGGGEAVWEAVEDRFEPEVDLDDPDHTFFVEAREDRAFVFVEQRDGPGGLPLGTQGRLVAMVSGGIDSPVAAWKAMKRGCEVVPLYFDFGDYGGPDHVARAVESVRKLARYAPGFEMGVRAVPAGEAADLLVAETDATRMLSLRRFMVRVAERIAEREDAHGIVTGEALGQKSSQTGPNLAITDRATTLPVHRPLFAEDKQEIIAEAKEIGTYEEATIPAGCNRIAPEGPATNANLDVVREAEPDLEPYVERAVDSLEVLSL